MATILSVIGFVSKLFGFADALEAWLQSRKDQQVGAERQAAADVKATAEVAQAEAQAVAQAPITKTEIIDTLNKGEF